MMPKPSRKTEWLTPLFFAFAVVAFVVVAIVPPVILFTLFKPFGAGVLSSGWIALMGFALFAFNMLRTHISVGTPAAHVAGMQLAFKLQNDRALAGEIDGIALEAIWSPGGTRIDASLPGEGAPPTLDAWSASLTEEQRLAMFEAVESGDLEVTAGKLHVWTALSFRVPEHGSDLVFRLRDAAKTAAVLSAAGKPPDGCVARLRDERRARAVVEAGALALAQPDPARGAVSLPAGEGNVSLAKKRPA